MVGNGLVSVFAQELGRPAKIAGAAIIAEAFPKTQDGLLVGQRQLLKRRELLEEALEIRNDGRYLSLLEHHLADPDAIRIAAFAPGEGACIPAIPRDKPATNFGARVGEGHVFAAAA